MVLPSHQKDIRLGSGYFFYTVASIYIGSLVILLLLWQEAWLITLLLSGGLLGLCLWSKNRFPWYYVAIPAVAIARIFSTLTTLDHEYLTQVKMIENQSPLEVTISRSLGIKNEMLVLQGSIIGSTALFELRVPPLTKYPTGKQNIRIRQYGKVSKFSASRGISILIWGDILPTNWAQATLKGVSQITQIIERSLPYPESALLAGILMGDASLMDDAFLTRYRAIGLSHLCVVSGSNISFVLYCIVFLCFFLPFHLRIFAATLCWIMYVGFVGGDAPVLRASIMGSIGLLSLIFWSTKTDPLRILVLAALLLCLYSPLSIVYDIGFHLSFLATIGILVSNTITRKQSIFVQLYSGSIFAAIWTLPLSIWTFWSIHSMSVAANVLVAPVINISIVSGSLFLLLQDSFPNTSYILWHICFLSLGYIDWIARVLWGFPQQFNIPEWWRELIGLLCLGLIIGWSLRFLYPWVWPEAVSDWFRQQ